MYPETAGLLRPLPIFLPGCGSLCFTPAMQSRIAALAMMVVHGSGPGGFRRRKKGKQGVGHVPHGDGGTDNPKMIFPPDGERPDPLFPARCRRSASRMSVVLQPVSFGWSARTTAWFSSSSPVPSTAWPRVTNANQGRWMIAQVNGRVVDGVLIDKQIGDGFIVIWKGRHPGGYRRSSTRRCRASVPTRKRRSNCHPMIRLFCSHPRPWPAAPGPRRIELRLPTENQHLFTGELDRFYMYVDRTFEGETQPSRGKRGTYGFVRTAMRINGEILLTKFHEGIDISPVNRDQAGNPLDLVSSIAAGRVAYVSPVAGQQQLRQIRGRRAPLGELVDLSRSTPTSRKSPASRAIR